MLAWPLVLAGVIQRTKAKWSGRLGQPLFQTFHDLVRLMRKRPVYSETTTPVFSIAPYVVLATALATAAIVPVLGSHPLVAFPFDFVFVAYAWGLGRVAIMLAALDTGSPFEGMGASREATFSALVEPALFLAIGTLGLATGASSLGAMLDLHGTSPALAIVRIGSLVALVILLQIESKRIPVDDPATHLELTMVHEVMILDHSGPDLAAMQYAAAVKLSVSASMIAMLVNPLARFGAIAGTIGHLAITVVVAIAIGTIESLVARLRLRAVPAYVAVAIGGAVVALFAAVWRAGGGA
jgi:formate hydrogenlyase subunit 4